MYVSYFLLFIHLFLFPPFTLQEGDLLFQDSDCGPFCDAIEKVTEGYRGANLSHVGIVIITDDHTVEIIEATGEGVIITPLQEFLERSTDKDGGSKVIVGRLKTPYQKLIPKAIKHAKKKLGKSYDDVFNIKNDKYYCSELVYESFKCANRRRDVFSLFPMTFVDPDVNKTFGIWVDYYEKLGEPIPEGEPGLNPGGISRSEKIEIVHMFGIPSGMNK